MAASTSTSSFFTSSGVPQSPISLSREEFNLFHNIDRKLFSRLVYVLGRDPGESVQVMALWIWLEHAGKEFNLVHKICVNLPDTLLNAMADESVMALNCIQSDEFNVESTINRDIPLMNALTQNGATLQFFHQHRLGIIRGVTKLINEVCLRAFDDLFPKPHQTQAEQAFLNPSSIGDQNMMSHHHVTRLHNPTLFNNPAAYEVGGGSNLGRPLSNQRVQHGVVTNNQQFWGPQHQHLYPMANALIRPDASLDYLRGIFDSPYDLAAQRQILNEEMGDMLNQLNLNDGLQEADEVSADERTIFLTFSKGYPISESEVREFFSRKFGDFIEDVFMQEVPLEEQPLYARLVVRAASSIPTVLDGKSKAKFSINGKHVWARKYVRKAKSPGEPSSPNSVGVAAADAAPTHQV